MNKREALEYVVEVMNDGHDGRITQACMDYYRAIPTGDKHVIKVARINGEAVGASVLQVVNDGAKNAITVIKRDNRRQGIAKKLVDAVLKECAVEGIEFSCGIAEDNEAAVGLMDKFSVPVAGTEQARRRSGEFTRRWYGAMPAKPAEVTIDSVTQDEVTIDGCENDEDDDF